MGKFQLSTWFLEKENKRLFDKPQERHYELWEEATDEQKEVLLTKFCDHYKIFPKLNQRSSPFAEDMKFFERMFMMLNAPAKRRIVIEKLATDPNTGRLNAF